MTTKSTDARKNELAKQHPMNAWRLWEFSISFVVLIGGPFCHGQEREKRSSIRRPSIDSKGTAKDATKSKIQQTPKSSTPQAPNATTTNTVPKELLTLKGHTNDVTRIAFSPDGTQFV